MLRRWCKCPTGAMSNCLQQSWAVTRAFAGSWWARPQSICGICCQKYVFWLKLWCKTLLAMFISFKMLSLSSGARFDDDVEPMMHSASIV